MKSPRVVSRIWLCFAFLVQLSFLGHAARLRLRSAISAFFKLAKGMCCGRKTDRAAGMGFLYCYPLSAAADLPSCLDPLASFFIFLHPPF